MTDNAENSSEARKPVLPPDNRVSLPREWPFRLLGNALILALVFLTAFLTVTVRTNLVGRQIDSLLIQQPSGIRTFVHMVNEVAPVTKF